MPDLFRLLFSAFLEDLGPVRWPGGWELPPLPLLPDIYPEKPVVTLRDLLSLLPSSPSAEDEAHLRRLLAFLWTREYWRPAAGEGTPVFEAVTADASPLAAAFLNDAGGEKVWIVSLKREEVSLPFVLILPGLSFRSARFTASHADFVPAEIAWFDRENGRFRDPVPFLSETDRSLLLDRLEQIDLPGLFAPFAEDLRAARDAETTSSPDSVTASG